MNINKEIGTKLWYFRKEILDYFCSLDDGTISNKLLISHSELEPDKIEEIANKGSFLKKIIGLTGIDLETLVGVNIQIEPRLSFDVSDCIVRASSSDTKTFFIYLFAENIDEKNASEVAEEFNDIGFDSKIFVVFRKQLFGLTNTLDLFLSDYVGYLSNAIKIDNVLIINPSKLVFALGAGCSIDAHIGNWQQLCDALSFELLSSEDNYGLTNYGSKNVNENLLNALSNNFDKNSLIDIAIRKKKNKDDKTLDYFKYVHDILYMNYDETRFDYMTSTLVSISDCIRRIKMKNVITYNFDSTLEKNINNNYRSTSNEVSLSKSCVAYESGKVDIYHVHGYLPYDYDGNSKVGNFILSDTDYYLNVLDDKGSSNHIQRSLFNKKDVIFIGCSFNDSNIKQVLLSLNENRTNRIYAIMKSPSFNDLIEGNKNKEANVSILKYKTLINNYLSYYGVKVIWIKDYRDISTIMNNIKKSTSDIEINVDEITSDI